MEGFNKPTSLNINKPPVDAEGGPVLLQRLAQEKQGELNGFFSTPFADGMPIIDEHHPAMHYVSDETFRTLVHALKDPMDKDMKAGNLGVVRRYMALAYEKWVAEEEKKAA